MMMIRRGRRRSVGGALLVLVLTACLGHFYILSRHQYYDERAVDRPVVIGTPPFQVLWAPQRIPGYIHTGNDTLVLFGHVMREFTRRVCARQIAQSHVLVVSPQAPQVVQLLQGKHILQEEEEEWRHRMNHQVGPCTLIHAHRQGHTYHGFNVDTLHQYQDQDWIFLAMFDHKWQNDQIMTLPIFTQSTITYIVLGIGAEPTDGRVFGKQAIHHLIQLHYKVQILSLSHAPYQSKHFKLLAPNTLVTIHNIHHIFDIIKTTAQQSGTPMYGYVFATQGLDLAIPTATVYTPRIHDLAGIQYKQCKPTDFNVQFYSPTKKIKNLFRVHCQGTRMSLDNTTTLWMSGETVETSEAICARAACGDSTPPKAACASRILPKEELWKQEESPTTKPNLLLLMVDPISRARFERSLVKTHRLIQMLNFTSFPQYTAVGNNSGPNQAALYSGKPLSNRQSIATHHQQTQWLWDTLRHDGYATFKAEDGCIENSNMIQSIRPNVHHGDALLSMMCFDFSRPNCIGETPAAQHLIQHAQQFIDAYQSAGRPWAAMLYFIDSHEDTQTLEGTLDDPLWRFLYQFYRPSQCDNGKDCSAVFEQTLVVLVSDHGLHYGSYLLSPKGLKERYQPMLHLHLPKTLQEDPQVAAALNANRLLPTTPFDVYQTMLEVLLPDLVRSTPDSTGSSLLRPLPVDRRDCATTDGIPTYVCDTLRRDENHPSYRNALMPNPPSIMSFFADIPAANKRTRPICTAQPDNSTIFRINATTQEIEGSCLCSTNKRDWYSCTEHPWAQPNQETLGEYFSMVDCVDARSFEIQVQRDPQVIQRPEVVREMENAEKSTSKPNILFIEMDSVSYAYADRHMPRTRELLASMRLRRSDRDPSGFTCQRDERMCAAEFEKDSVVGPSSIPNQIAVFGACRVTVGPERCEQLETNANNQTICTDSTHPVFGMEMINRLRTSATFCPLDERGRSPWIFDIAKSAGYVTLFAEEFCYEGSIYVPQGNIFPLNVDIEPGKFFCQTTRLRAKREDIPINGRPAWLFAYQSNPGEPNCVHKDGGYESALVALKHVETMWNSYPDIPKLAYVNVMAAHEYADFQFMAEKAETYDLILSTFLEQILARDDADNTIIVVRADHGIQGGLVTTDYSIQIEALRPWTEVIVPKNFHRLSLNHLFENQQRLVTGFDFYKTLTTIMVGNSSQIMPPPPHWTSHLWQEEVSISRTCEDARVSNDYCLFEGQRTFTAPNIRSCNLVEPEQRLVCPLMVDEFVESMSKFVSHSFHTDNIRPKVCSGGESLEPTISPSLASVWQELDTVASRWPPRALDSSSSAPPPRQLAILKTIVSDLSDAIHTAESRSLNVCQTGFGQGHSAAMFLDASPNVRLSVFANLDHTSDYLMKGILMNGSRGRMKHSKCDSCLAMLEFQRKKGRECDFLHGLAASPNGYSDSIVDLVRKAPCGVILSSVATKSLRDPRVYFGSQNQWTKLRAEECIGNIHCFNDSSVRPRQKFCLAVTTGKCQQPPQGNGQCTSKIAAATKRIVLSEICPAHEIAIPMPTLTKITPTTKASNELINSVSKMMATKLSHWKKRLPQLKEGNATEWEADSSNSMQRTGDVTN